MSKPVAKVPCPDCGEMFLARGLASHRRQKHGVHATKARAPEPGIDLAPVLEALARIEARLERLEAASVQTDGAPENDLQLRLDEVLAQIRAVLAERETLEGDWADQQREACDLELAELRRQQTDLLVALDELTFH